MSQLSLAELENNLVLKGIDYIVSNHPSKKTPLQLYFLFAGDAELEIKIIRGIIEKGYSISRIWFVDIAYKDNDRTLSILNNLEKIPFFTNNIFENSSLIIHIRHATNLKYPNKIPPNLMFKVGDKNSKDVNVIFITDFNDLTSLVENYVPVNDNIVTFAIHHQALGEGAGDKIGNFYKMYFTKFNKPIVFMWRQSPYIAVVDPHPDSKFLSPSEVYKYSNTKQRELLYETNRERHTYKGHSYVIRIGKRGGKYILVNDKKIYL